MPSARWRTVQAGPPAAGAPAKPPSTAAPRRAGADDSAYIRGLETQLRAMSQTVRSLDAKLAEMTKRNRRIEAARSATPVVADSDVARQQLHDAEANARAVTERARIRADEIEQRARAHAQQLIATVEAEVGRIEQEVGLAAAAEADGSGAGEARQVRGEIADLLHLREAILLNIGSALDGFGRELSALGRPPLAEPGEGAGSEGGSGAGAAATAASGPTVEVELRPIGGVLDASRLERELGSLEGVDAHLRSVEGDVAHLLVTGIEGSKLDSAIAARLDTAECEWSGDGVLRVRLAPTSESKAS